MRARENWWLVILTALAVVISVVAGVAVQRQRADAAVLAAAAKKASIAKARGHYSGSTTTSGAPAPVAIASATTTTTTTTTTTGTTTTTTTAAKKKTTKKTTRKKPASTTTTSTVTVRAAEVGDVVQFGQLGGAPLRWQILSLDAKRIVLLTQEVLAASPYQSDENLDDMTPYNTSTVRSWLNTTFVPAAFGTTATANPVIGRSSASDAVAGDIAYLLTADQLKRYLPEADDRIASSSAWGQSNAGADGSSVLAAGPVYWWLAADPDVAGTNVAPVVQSSGAINTHRYAAIETDGIRPCIKLVSSALSLTALTKAGGLYAVSPK